MTDPEKVLMRGTAQALSLNPDRIHGGVSTRDDLTAQDVGFALAGMREAGLDPAIIQRVEAALDYMVLGTEWGRMRLYELLIGVSQTRVKSGRWVKNLDGRRCHVLASLAVNGALDPPLDTLLKGNDAVEWHRDYARPYAELRELMDGWRNIGMAHVRRRTADEDE